MSGSSSTASIQPEQRLALVVCVHPVPVVESPAGETVPGAEELAQKDARKRATASKAAASISLHQTVMQPSDRRSATFSRVSR